MARVCISIAFIAFFTIWTCDATILNYVRSINSTENVNFCRDCVCGINRKSRIVDGEVSSFEEFPWAVQIKLFDKHRCGGSLITPKHILTAAHCITPLHVIERRYLTVHLADNTKYRIKSLKAHEKFDFYKKTNDIGIIDLIRPVPMNGIVKTVCLPHIPTFNYTGMTGVVIGWGQLGYDAPLSKELRKVHVPIMSQENCLHSRYYNSTKHTITENMFCAGYPEGGRDSCLGDSGGPLLVRNHVSAMEVVGIISFGEGCAEPNYPGVYTKVINYLDWINSHLSNDLCFCTSSSDYYGDYHI